MQRTLALIFFVFLFPASLFAADRDPLWVKAVEMARRNKPWVAGTTIVRADIFDDKGVSTDVLETLLLTSPDAQGAPVMKVEKSVHNGKDVTASQREAMEKNNADAGKGNATMSFSADDSPFNPDVQASVRVVNTGDTASVGGVPCALFTYTFNQKNGAVQTGAVALNKETGAPIEVKYTLKPLPSFMWSFTATLKYSDGPAGQGFLKEVVMDGDGGFLLFKRVFHSTITLDGYWDSGT
jgi:hypothetical protein